MGTFTNVPNSINIDEKPARFSTSGVPSFLVSCSQLYHSSAEKEAPDIAILKKKFTLLWSDRVNEAVLIVCESIETSARFRVIQI